MYLRSARDEMKHIKPMNKTYLHGFFLVVWATVKLTVILAQVVVPRGDGSACRSMKRRGRLAMKKEEARLEELVSALARGGRGEGPGTAPRLDPGSRRTRRMASSARRCCCCCSA